MVGGAARRRLRAGQPAARGRADRADGTVAVPADLAPVRQSAVPAGRGDPRVRRPAPAWPHPQGARRAAGRARRASDADRPRRRVEGQARGAGKRLSGQAVRGPGAGLRRPTAHGKGRSLDDFATWCALAEQHGDDWHEWPEELRHPAGPAVAEFAAEHADDRRLPPLAAVAARRAARRRAGRRPSRRAWSSASCTTSRSACIPTAPTPGRCRTCSRSASPWARRRTSSTSSARTGRSRRGGPTGWPSMAYEPFRDMVNAVLRHAGGVRVDHIIGLFRLWWIPEGAPPDRGHLRALRPRGDDRHPRAGGAPGRRRRGRRGSRHGRAVGARLPARTRPARHVDPVVRARPRRRRRTAAGRAVARVLPVLGHHARPAADRRLSGRRPCAAARRARPADPSRRRGAGR